MLASNVKITFIIPCHNSGQFLNEAINSILSQSGTFTINEVIVSNDRSTDKKTLDILEQLSNQPKVRVLQSIHQPGPGGARNAGVEHATTEWISFLDADDLLLPGAIQARVNAIETFPDAEFIGADFQLWWPESNKTDTPFFRSREEPKKLLKKSFEENKSIRLKRPVKEFIDSALTNSGTTLLKKESFQKVGGYEESIRYCEDHHLWIKLARITDFIFVPKSIMLYRQHDENMTNITTPPSQLFTKALLLLLNDNNFSNQAPYIKKKLSSLHTATATWHRTQGNFTQSSFSSLRGIMTAPSNFKAWKQLFASLIHKP